MTQVQPLQVDTTGILTAAINRRLMEGYVLVSRDEFTAVVARPGKGPSHLLHLILSLVTIGLWIPVWILLSIFQRREKRLMLSVSPDGRVSERS